MVKGLRFLLSRFWNYCTSSVHTDMTSAADVEKELEQKPYNEVNDTLQECLRQARAERKKSAMLVVTGDSGTDYSILKVIGKGGFGEVYKAEVNEVSSTIDDIPNTVAIKVEHPKSIDMEIQILNTLKNSIHFCTLYDRGFDPSSGHYFVVMTLLGPNLSFIRKSMPKQHLTFQTGIRVAIQMLSAIEQLHAKGFVSRDVKPSNFAIGLPTQRQRLIYMLDFGIALCYLNADGTPKKQSSNCSWKGTTRYCPLVNHRRVSPSPKDDLESWLYSIVELLTGSLPWASFDKTAKEQTYKLKLECRTHYKYFLFNKCPEEFEQFLSSIDSYNYYDKPNYSKFFVTLTRILDRNNISFTDVYDWQLIFEPYIMRVSLRAHEE